MTLKVISYGPEPTPAPAPADAAANQGVMLSERLRKAGLEAQAEALTSGKADIIARADAAYRRLTDNDRRVMRGSRDWPLKQFATPGGIPDEALSIIEEARSSELFRGIVVERDTNSVQNAQAFTVVARAVDAFGDTAEYVIVRWGDDIESLDEVWTRWQNERTARRTERAAAIKDCRVKFWLLVVVGILTLVGGVSVAFILRFPTFSVIGAFLAIACAFVCWWFAGSYSYQKDELMSEQRRDERDERLRW